MENIVLVAGVFMRICAGISAVGAASAWIYKCIKAAQAPGKTMKDRLDALEKRVDEHEKKLKEEDDGQKEIEHGIKVMQQCLFVIMDYLAAPDENKHKLSEVKGKFTEHIIEG